MTKEPDIGARTARPLWLMALLAVVTGVVAYTLFSGGSLQKAMIPGWLEFDFAPRPPAAPAPLRPAASREFILGEWEVEQWSGSNAANTRLTYYADGTVKGWGTYAGLRTPWTGQWDFEKLSDDTFRLNATINGATMNSSFRIFDRDHIQNLDNNYMAVRVP